MKCLSEGDAARGGTPARGYALFYAGKSSPTPPRPVWHDFPRTKLLTVFLHSPQHPVGILCCLITVPASHQH
ncbi:hypothetical protein E2C01_022706 [Portunus trituberculatus]|uniref:Uncharacterized protein n=1 Tax=Portunus trituberculatus TaxID=210409 RepID=A0A5B7E635_PORTR|nr:hypothetical protein [Portunus trituberculatus]